MQPEITKVAFPNQYLDIRKKELEEKGFEIIDCGEVFQPIKFFDVGALVWFAKIIEWEFVNFKVDTYLDNRMVYLVCLTYTRSSYIIKT